MFAIESATSQLQPTQAADHLQAGVSAGESQSNRRAPSVIIRLGQGRRSLLPSFRRAGSSALDAYRRHQVAAQHQEAYLNRMFQTRTRDAAEDAAAHSSDPQATLEMLTKNLDLVSSEGADHGLRALAEIRAQADFGQVTEQLSRWVMESGVLDAQERLRSGLFIDAPPSIEIRID